MATRLIRPPLGAVIAASIFIASMVAIGSPALTLSPSVTVRVTTPANGAATWPGLALSAFLGGGDVAGDGAVAHRHRPQLAVEDAHDRAHAPLVGVGDGFQPDQQRDTLLQVHAMLLAAAQTIEELVGRQA
jgi:hypothetical protein